MLQQPSVPPRILPISVRDSISKYISNHFGEYKEAADGKHQFWDRMNEMFAENLGYSANTLYKEYCISAGLTAKVIRDKMKGSNQEVFLGYKFLVYPEKDTEESRRFAFRVSIVISYYGGDCVTQDVCREGEPDDMNIDVEPLCPKEYRDDRPFFHMNHADVLTAVKCQPLGISLNHWPFSDCCKPAYLRE